MCTEEMNTGDPREWRRKIRQGKPHTPALHFPTRQRAGFQGAPSIIHPPTWSIVLDRVWEPGKKKHSLVRRRQVSNDNAIEQCHCGVVYGSHVMKGRECPRGCPGMDSQKCWQHEGGLPGCQAGQSTAGDKAVCTADRTQENSSKQKTGLSCTRGWSERSKCREGSPLCSLRHWARCWAVLTQSFNSSPGTARHQLRAF